MTFFGSRRTADIVLPDDEPVGGLLPEVLDLLEEPPAVGGAPVLVTTVGQRIDMEGTLASQDIAQGAMMRIVPEDDAPQSPEIADVTDTVGQVREARRDIWTATSTTATAAGAAVILTLYAAGTWSRLDPSVTPWLIAAAALAAALATLAARRDIPGPAAVLAGLAGGTAVAGLLAATDGLPVVLRLSASTGALWLVIGLVRGVGARRPSALAGAVLGLANAAGVGVVTALAPGVDTGVLAVFVAVANVVVLGLLPGVAAAASGLTRYDDLVIGGEPTTRRVVESVVEDAFAALTWSLAAVLPVLALSAHALLTEDDAWSFALGISVSLVALLRMRMFPLMLQKLLVLVTVGPALGSWLASTPELSDPQKVAIALAVASACLVTSLVSPAPVTLARIRRGLSTLELFAVLAVLPSALGALGIFADLFGVFR
nr:EsaB/YukD family protein [Brachybacterium fresconis]